MKIETSKTDLKSALSSVNVALGKATNDNPISGHYVFRVTEDSKVEVLTAHRYMGSSTILNCIVEDQLPDDMFTIEGSRFSQWIEAVPDTVITISYDRENRVTVVSVDADDIQTSAEFGSVDPELFTFWDSQKDESVLKATIPDSRVLASALSYAQDFALDKAKDRQSPGYCNVEAKEGTLHAADGESATFVTLEGLSDCSFSLHSSSVSNALKFLKKDQKVKILEHTNTTFFVLEDASLLGITKPSNSIPPIKIDRSQASSFSLTFNVSLLKSSMASLAANSSESNKKIQIRWSEKSSPSVTLAMASMTGKEQKATMRIVSYTLGDQERDLVFPKAVMLNRDTLSKILDQWSETTVTIDFILSKKEGHGYCRFLEDRKGIEVFTVLPWAK